MPIPGFRNVVYRSHQHNGWVHCHRNHLECVYRAKKKRRKEDSVARTLASSTGGWLLLGWQFLAVEYDRMMRQAQCIWCLLATCWDSHGESRFNFLAAMLGLTAVEADDRRQAGYYVSVEMSKVIQELGCEKEFLHSYRQAEQLKSCIWAIMSQL